MQITIEEIKKALSIEVTEQGDMCSEWVLVELKWDDEVISSTECLRKGND